jgi:hypothetical protein
MARVTDSGKHASLLRHCRKKFYRTGPWVISFPHFNFGSDSAHHLTNLRVVYAFRFAVRFCIVLMHSTNLDEMQHGNLMRFQWQIGN